MNGASRRPFTRSVASASSRSTSSATCVPCGANEPGGPKRMHVLGEVHLDDAPRRRTDSPRMPSIFKPAAEVVRDVERRHDDVVDASRRRCRAAAASRRCRPPLRDAPRTSSAPCPSTPAALSTALSTRIDCAPVSSRKNQSLSAMRTVTPTCPSRSISGTVWTRSVASSRGASGANAAGSTGSSKRTDVVCCTVSKRWSPSVITLRNAILRPLTSRQSA